MTRTVLADGLSSVATNGVSRKPRLGGGGPELPLDGWWAPRSRPDHTGKVQGPPGNRQGP